MPALLRLFVYGTLRTDRPANTELCRGALSVLPARVRGRLTMLADGYSGLVVDPAHVLALGSLDALADVALQERLDLRLAEAISGAWVQGELLTFADPVQRLPRLDEYECFQPGMPSLYHRVLLRVEAEEPTTAWAYVVPG